MSPAGVAPAKRRLFSQIESESERITGNTSITERRTETSVTVRLRASSDRLKVRGQDRYLYRAVDSTGQTIDFLLTARRDAGSAKRFFRKLFLTSANVPPRVINVDRNPAYPVAVEQLKQDGTLRRRCRVRQCKYLNNMIEQDHRTRQTSRLASHGLRLLPQCVADSSRHRSGQHDPQRKSKVGG